MITVGSMAAFFYLNLKDSILQRTFAQLSAINMLKKSDVEERMTNRINEFELVNDIYQFKSIIRNDSVDIDIKWDSLLLKFEYDEILLLNSNKKPIFNNLKHNKSIEVLQFLNNNNLRSIQHLELSTKNDSIPFIFLISPITDQNKLLGYVALREKFDPTQQILYLRTGMGKSGETYIVGSDKLMRSKSRFLKNKFPLEILVDTKATNEALTYNSGNAIIQDYRDVTVLSVYRPLNIQGLNWAIITEIDLKEAMVPVSKAAYKLFWISTAILILISLVSWLIAKRISSPISYLSRVILELAKGRVPEINITSNSKDEIGQILEAMNLLVDSLNRTSEFATQIGRGNFKANYKPLSHYDKVGHALMDMKDELIQLNIQKSSLEKKSKKLLLKGQEDERARVAKELHDGIGPLLTTIKLRIGKTKKNEEVLKIIDDTIVEVRRLSSNLMPAVLLDFGIGPALNNLVKSFQVNGKIKFQYVDNTLPDVVLNNDINICLYRIAQEAINNIMKHSKATRIKISVTQFENSIAFYISDNGIGFNISNYLYSKKDSNGIRNMEERVKLLDGTFIINSTDKGTEIEVEIPINNG